MSRLSLPSLNSKICPHDIDPELLMDVQTYLSNLNRGETTSESLRIAFQGFYEKYDPVIRKFGVKCNLPGVDLDECTQEVWFKLLTKLPEFEYQPERSRFQSWLYAVIRHQIIDLHRRRSQTRVIRLTTLAATNLVTSKSDPAIQFEQASDEEDLFGVRDELRSIVSEKSFRVVQLRCIEGRSIAEIAMELILTPAQVRLQLCRLKKQLKRLTKRHLSLPLNQPSFE